MTVARNAGAACGRPAMAGFVTADSHPNADLFETEWPRTDHIRPRWAGGGEERLDENIVVVVRSRTLWNLSSARSN